jgi:protein-disulfide isomerase
MYTEERLTKKELKELRKEERMTNQEDALRLKKQNKVIKISIVVLVVFLLGWWWKSAQLPIPESEKSKPIDRILTNDWTLGNVNAAIKVIEYSDFQCPACKAYAGADELLVKTFGDKVGVAYRNFPLREIHRNANLAAQAAEAAGKQGKFWEMGTVLFEKQEQWSESTKAHEFFSDYAKQIGLNVDTFKKDIGTKETRALVEADYLSALLAKINATPTFIVNGQKMNNLRGPEDLVARVDLLLKEATGSAQQ